MKTLPHRLFRHWVHVQEQDVPEAKTYRPFNYPIPSAAGRDGIAFQTDGGVIRYDGGASGAGVTGSWIQRDDEVLVLSFPDWSAPVNYRVAAAKPDLLELTPLDD